MSHIRRVFSLVLLCCAVTGMVIDVGDDADQERGDDKTKKDEVELYHPGTTFAHITRLGRFLHDKGGMALLTKAEAAFTDRTKKKDKPASLEQTLDKPDVILMPSSYHKVLREHQKELKKMKSQDASPEKVTTADPIHEDHKSHEAAMVQDGQVPIADASAHGVPISNSEDPLRNSGGNDSVIMPLRLLRSEYMGPMGVGTMIPKHCRQDAMSAMAGMSATTWHGLHHQRRQHSVASLDGEGETISSQTDGDFIHVDRDSSSPRSAWNRKNGVNRHQGLQEQSSDVDFDPNSALDRRSVFRGEPGSSSSSDCSARQQTYLNVVYDTGSTNIWISSDLCETGGCVLPGRRRFNHLESTTFSFPEDSPTLSVQFGTGKLSGPLGTDNLRVGPASVRQTFAMMQNQAGWIWEDVPIEGIVGLGFPSLANTDGHPPFFDSVIQQKVLKRNEFAFYVSRENPAANAIMWGGVDSRFYAGRIEWFPVVDPHYWALELAQFRVGNVSFHFLKEERSRRHHNAGLVDKPKKHGPVAVLDTGTSVLGFSGTVLSNLVQMLPEASCTEVLEDGANGAELKYPDMVFVLRNKAGQVREWTLTGRQYMSRDEEGDLCSPSIMTLDLPAEHGPGLVLGDVFLREYFSVYNRRDGTPEAAEVGLARSKRTEDIVDHLKSLTEDQQSLLHT